MIEENQTALRKAFKTAVEIEKYSQMGNMEIADRLTTVYNSILLTVLVTELVPGAQETLKQVEDELIAKLMPAIAEDGTVIQ